MRKILIIVTLALIFGFQNLKAQRNEINKTFDKYIEATKSENLEEQLDYYHPEIFNHFSKDSILLAFEMIKSNPMVKVGNEKLVSISEIYFKNSSNYALLTFTQKMTMDISDMKNQGGSSTAISYMLIDLRQQYGEDNVKFDDDLYMVEIMMTNKFYSIRDQSSEEWKFIPKDDDSKNIIENIIPETIRRKI